MRKPEKHLLVIFGASGDLTYRKLVPSVFDLFTQNLLPDEFGILGLGRTELSNAAFREKMSEGIEKFAMTKPHNRAHLEQFLDKLFYYAFSTKEESEYLPLKLELEKLNQQLKTENNYIFYLATPPSMYPIVPAHLAKHGLNNEDDASNASLSRNHLATIWKALRV
ncbi:hypothetical protein [Geofilum rubicundum]|uniref:Glucose-6-phosphate 1-dehydrogenase n=1 Tax=Geofilum rubicundum JCM 15548 TaxID=1236989 RepID=A0A0E9M2I8_9BACT|nr:hypothetical protein [Geofilum rubicundum]GAO31734.1 glucose-6-phosphate 1-dehydrogenase [Geofilum rubicundum JCM 15548]